MKFRSVDDLIVFNVERRPFSSLVCCHVVLLSCMV